MASSNSNDWKDRKQPKVLCLFDVDGTLTPARGKIGQEMKDKLAKLRKECVVGFLGGSNFVKQIEQLGAECVNEYDFCFTENGLVSYRLGVELPQASFIGFLGEDRYKKLVNFILRYIADLDIPIKRGTFVEFRNGMINVSPIGRNCSQAERKEYEKFDLEHKIRDTFVQRLREEFPDYGLQYSIGGEISFDVFPIGWDKTYSLNHLVNEGFESIHFFGDKTFKGGNDYEMFTHEGVIGHTVTDPLDTIKQLFELFGI
ncbi:Phosphomannomutase [Zancudomyces culisetae]|uniref:Phosphomannomutase n=1 Tax=Zancudomyces culisetae TaxID=1213189 RepID=A0A1R1PME0_ZANCU|nr:Phosphomannomutase [Zancudomyces culisetae]|eukprot:OMH82103.1 Phosphomannomutase [Zancudomyces culisetae]